MLDPTDLLLSREAGEAHHLYGIELGKADKAAQAAREFQEAVHLMPEVIEARLNLGIALYQDGQLDASQTEFEQVAARSPTNVLAQHYLELLRNRSVRSASPKSKVQSPRSEDHP
jgi:Flp pilus assembly protein TadD